jgi:hypothetical protein
MDYSKTTPAGGVDSHYADSDRVLVKPEELPTPLRPGDDGFWAEFEAVIVAVAGAKDGAKSHRMVAQCLLDAGYDDAAKQAELVHRDRPTAIMTIAASTIKSKFRSFKPLDKSKFTDKVVLLDSLMAMSAHMVSPSSFSAKWHHMLARPEEVAQAIAKGELAAPDDIVRLLANVFDMSELAKKASTFTMYPEGCPNHPSYNAMHSAAAGAEATILKTMYNLTKDETAEVDMCARNMAFFRTRAGVHYPQDNRAGLWLGQEVVKRWLPDFLFSLGVARAPVKKTLEKVSTDWLLS